MDFFSIIGTVASIGSIPLSIYLYIKSGENNIDRVKREIVKILSHQIGDRRQLTSFEIQTVINSKAREFKVDIEKITVSLIIEDLVAESISNPLLDKSIKETILNELKNIYFKSQLLSSIDNIERETRSDREHSEINFDLEGEIKQIIQKRREVETEMDSQKIKLTRTSDYFAIIAAITTLLASLAAFIGKEKYDDVISKPIYDFLKNNDFYISLLGGILASITASVALVIFRKFNNR